MGVGTDIGGAPLRERPTNSGWALRRVRPQMLVETEPQSGNT